MAILSQCLPRIIEVSDSCDNSLSRANIDALTPQTIEDAAIQVLSGTTGFATEQLRQRLKSGTNPNSKVFFFPVIVTTARLYVANYRTDRIDLESGTISRDNVEFGDGELPEEGRWVLLNYPANQALALAGVPAGLKSSDPSVLDEYKIRSIYIVNAKSLLAFFDRLNRTIPILE